jgi:acyl transferase domain-containing protein
MTNKSSQTRPPITPRPPIAIVGVSALCPGASTTDGFLDVIFSGKDQIRDVPRSRFRLDWFFDPDPSSPLDKTYCRRGAFIDAVPFDPMEYGIPPSVLTGTDSAQLIALMKAKEAFADAKADRWPDIARERVSVIIGAQGMTQLQALMMMRTRWPLWKEELRKTGLSEAEVEAAHLRIANDSPEWQEMTFPGFLGNIISGRVTNRMDFGGTNYIVDAACASSLAAMSAALNELYLGQCDLVITGGVDLLTDVGSFISFSKSQALSKTGDCRPFSKSADGTVIGEGVVLFALRRLEDAEADGDDIYAVIRGHGTSSDGRGSAIYAPRREGQVRAMRRAYEAAGYEPKTVSLVEAHGTGTPIGDTTEIASMCEIFGPREEPCALGSVKSQIGHAKTSAGAVALFKVAAALRHGILPPTIKVGEPSDVFKTDDCPFYLSTEARPWISGADHPRRASLSAFGFGGTNAHLTVEEYVGPKRAARRLALPAQLFLITGATREAALASADELVARAERGVPLDGLARESQRNFSQAAQHRLSLVAADKAELRAIFEKAKALITKTGKLPPSGLDGVAYAEGPAESGKIAFMFPGQGSQYVGMTGALAMHFDAARAVWDKAASAALADGTAPLHNAVFPRPAYSPEARDAQETALRATEMAQPALGTASLSLLTLLDELGLKADMTFGHSFGEIMALHAAGAFDATAAIKIARARGKLMSEAGAGIPAAMSAVAMPSARVAAAIAETGADVVIANHNAPNQVVISGRTAEVAKVEAVLPPDLVRRLPVSTAFHSPVVAPSVAAFRPVLDAQWTRTPTLPVIANINAAAYPDDLATSRNQLAQQIANQVRFVDCVNAAYEAGARLFVEVGPGEVLTGLVAKCLEGRQATAIALDSKKKNGVAAFFQGLGRLAVAGVPLNFDVLWEGRRCAEPVAPPQLKKHVVWIDSTMARTSEMQRSQQKPAAPADEAPPARLNGAGAGKPIASKEPGAHSVEVERREYSPKPNGAAHTTSSASVPPVTAAPPAVEPPVRTMPTALPMQAPVARSVLMTGGAVDQLVAEVSATQALFLSTMMDGHKAFLQFARTALDAGVVPEAAPEFLMPMAALETPAPAAQPIAAMAPPPSAAPEEAPIAPAPSMEEAPRVEQVPRAAAAAPAAVPSFDPAQIGALVLEIIAEKTGYPVEMLEETMELEGDLGVDSIRRVEIFMALRDRLPGFPEPSAADQAALAKLTTIRDVTTFLASQAGTVAAAVPAGEPASPQPVAAEPITQPPAAAGPDREALAAIVLDVIADKTGYPADMLALEMDLEADLGIDSIKRMEVLMAIRERVPGALPEPGAANVSTLTALKTLEDVLDLLTQALAGETAPAAPEAAPAPTPSSSTAPHAAAPPADDHLDSRALAFVPSRASGMPLQGLSAKGPILIIPDEGGIAEALQSALIARGADCMIASAPAGECSKIIFLGGLTKAEGPPSALPLHLAAFRAAKLLAASAQAQSGLFVTVQDTGGRFGLAGQADARAWHAGLAGIAKTVAKCFPGISAKAVDIERGGRNAKAIAEAIAGELYTGAFELEVGLDKAGGRWVPTLLSPDEAPSPTEAAPALDDGAVIVVSGGARGVTAACIEALARAYRPRFLILGRSPLAEEAPSLADAESDAAIKRILMDEARARGETLKPAELGRRTASILAAREVRACLATLAAFGSEALYVSADVRDATQVAGALEQARGQWGPITGLIHAAGVIADKRIAEKTEGQFTDVFETKVAGLANLLAATRGDPLRFIVAFSSVAGRFGNVGQIDYAAANEVLNKVAQAEARRRGETCRVLSLNWGAWDGGMVSPELARHMQAARVELIPLKAGADFLLTRLTQPVASAVELVVTPESNLALLGETAPHAPAMHAAVEAAE